MTLCEEQLRAARQLFPFSAVTVFLVLDSNHPPPLLLLKAFEHHALQDQKAR